MKTTRWIYWLMWLASLAAAVGLGILTHWPVYAKVILASAGLSLLAGIILNVMRQKVVRTLIALPLAEREIRLARMNRRDREKVSQWMKEGMS